HGRSPDDARVHGVFIRKEHWEMQAAAVFFPFLQALCHRRGGSVFPGLALGFGMLLLVDLG
ncbi:hypothetical protein, partial [Akkermansia sp.]|uniref:hypothetical protein n=1 Tax=Akkermansia sp. TaxID=1872421 RepID=UPI003A842A00